MKLRYRTAIIGFCPDLTDPNASSIPVASLLVGEGEGEGERLGAAVVVLPPDKHLPLDELSRAMLADVPALLRRHVDEAMNTLPADAPLENILHSLHDGLRNSLQVLAISEETTLEVNATTSPRGIYEPVLERGLAVLREALEAIGVELIPWPEPESASHRRSVPATRTVRRLPETSVWPLREAVA